MWYQNQVTWYRCGIYVIRCYVCDVNVLRYDLNVMWYERDAAWDDMDDIWSAVMWCYGMRVIWVWWTICGRYMLSFDCDMIQKLNSVILVWLWCTWCESNVGATLMWYETVMWCLCGMGVMNCDVPGMDRVWCDVTWEWCAVTLAWYGYGMVLSAWYHVISFLYISRTKITPRAHPYQVTWNWYVMWFDIGVTCDMSVIRVWCVWCKRDMAWYECDVITFHTYIKTHQFHISSHSYHPISCPHHLLHAHMMVHHMHITSCYSDIVTKYITPYHVTFI